MAGLPNNPVLEFPVQDLNCIFTVIIFITLITGNKREICGPINFYLLALQQKKKQVRFKNRFSHKLRNASNRTPAHSSHTPR